MLELENLKEAFGRTNPWNRPSASTTATLRWPSPSRRSSGSLEVCLRRHDDGLLGELSDRSVAGRRQQLLDGDYAQEVAVGDNGDVGRVRRLSPDEALTYVTARARAQLVTREAGLTRHLIEDCPHDLVCPGRRRRHRRSVPDSLRKIRERVGTATDATEHLGADNSSTMHARAVDDAAAHLRELRNEEAEFAPAALALGLSLAATQVRPALALPLFLGGVVVGVLGTRAFWRC